MNNISKPLVSVLLRGIATLGLIGILVLLTGCGSSNPDTSYEHSVVRSVVKKSVTARADHRWQDWCSTLSGDSRARVGFPFESFASDHPRFENSSVSSCSSRMQSLHSKYPNDPAFSLESLNESQGFHKSTILDEIPSAQIYVWDTDSEDSGLGDSIARRASVTFNDGGVLSLVQVKKNPTDKFYSNDYPGRWYIER